MLMSSLHFESSLFHDVTHQDVFTAERPPGCISPLDNAAIVVHVIISIYVVMHVIISIYIYSIT